MLESDLGRFVAAAGAGEWALVWAAGCGVVTSDESELEAETRVVERLLRAVASEHPSGRGAVFLASSAGGVYAGSTGPPFTETTDPRPVSAYGRAKLRQEELAAALLAGVVPLVIGRLSNLYGPGQNLAKPQGLVSHLCLAAASRRPLHVFVPMETLRDYLYADDAAAMVTALVAAAVRDQPDEPVLRNLASGRPISVAGVLRLVQQVAHRHVQIALGAPAPSGDQVRDLRLVASDAEGGVRAVTPLPVGVKHVYEHTLRVLREQPLAPNGR